MQAVAGRAASTGNAARVTNRRAAGLSFAFTGIFKARLERPFSPGFDCTGHTRSLLLTQAAHADNCRGSPLMGI